MVPLYLKFYASATETFLLLKKRKNYFLSMLDEFQTPFFFAWIVHNCPNTLPKEVAQYVLPGAEFFENSKYDIQIEDDKLHFSPLFSNFSIITT